MEKTTTPIRRMLAVLIALAMAVTMLPLLNGGQAKAASKGTYKLEVNKSRCVVVAYKKTDGKWKYVRTMRCSTGSTGRTPSGTFHLGGKQRWGVLMGPVYGQYCCNITSSILFHSVWYHSPSKRSQSIPDFNKLGRPASHGCVRLATIDAKWIYDKCKRGTLIKIGNNKRVPKGKPKKIYSSSGWDPTDPDPSNPHNKLKKAVIKATDKTLIYGKKYKAKKFIKVTNPNALEDITDIAKVRFLKGGKWKTASTVPTNKCGKVKVKIEAKYGYCKNNTKAVTYTIVDNSRPSLKAKSRTVKIGSKNAVKGVSAKLKSGKSVTKGIKVTIKNPKGKTVAKSISCSKAKAFVFDREGKYKVTLVATNPQFVNKTKQKTITIKVIDDSKKEETQPVDNQENQQQPEQPQQ